MRQSPRERCKAPFEHAHFEPRRRPFDLPVVPADQALVAGHCNVVGNHEIPVGRNGTPSARPANSHGSEP